jgi:hypothetical protein
MCPDDAGWAPSIAQTTTCSPLSYVVNYTKNTINGNGVYAFGNRTGTPQIDPDCTSSQVTAPSLTVMLGEKNSGTSPLTITSPYLQWCNATVPWSNSKNALAFNWIVTPSTPPPTVASNLAGVSASTTVPTNHPGVVIVAFFDGGVKTLSDSFVCAPADGKTPSASDPPPYAPGP